MSDKLDLIFLFLGWIFLDFIGLITLIKPANIPRNWRNNFDFKTFITRKHSLGSLGTEIIGIILLISSFSSPWYYRLLGHIGGIGYHIDYRYFTAVSNLDDIFSVFLFYVYYLGLAIIFVKISVNIKIRFLSLLELTELILLIPGVILIFTVKFSLPPYLAIFVYLSSGYSYGFILYLIGISILITNALQISIYLRLNRSKTQTISV